MKRYQTIFTGMVLACLLLASSCSQAVVEDAAPGENQDSSVEPSADPAEPENPSGDYWDGGDYPQRPVYSLTFGISQTAHDAFTACGLHDNAIETAVESYLPSGAERQMIVAQDSQKETLWSVSLTVKPLTADIYEVACTKIEP